MTGPVGDLREAMSWTASAISEREMETEAASSHNFYIQNRLKERRERNVN